MSFVIETALDGMQKQRDRVRKKERKKEGGNKKSLKRGQRRWALSPLSLLLDPDPVKNGRHIARSIMIASELSQSINKPHCSSLLLPERTPRSLGVH